MFPVSLFLGLCLVLPYLTQGNMLKMEAELPPLKNSYKQAGITSPHPAVMRFNYSGWGSGEAAEEHCNTSVSFSGVEEHIW